MSDQPFSSADDSAYGELMLRIRVQLRCDYAADGPKSAYASENIIDFLEHDETEYNRRISFLVAGYFLRNPTSCIHPAAAQVFAHWYADTAMNDPSFTPAQRIATLIRAHPVMPSDFLEAYNPLREAIGQAVTQEVAGLAEKPAQGLSVFFQLLKPEVSLPVKNCLWGALRENMQKGAQLAPDNFIPDLLTLAIQTNSPDVATHTVRLLSDFTGNPGTLKEMAAAANCRSFADTIIPACSQAYERYLLRVSEHSPSNAYALASNELAAQQTGQSPLTIEPSLFRKLFLALVEREPQEAASITLHTLQEPLRSRAPAWQECERRWQGIIATVADIPASPALAFAAHLHRALACEPAYALRSLVHLTTCFTGLAKTLPLEKQEGLVADIADIAFSDPQVGHALRAAICSPSKLTPS